MDKQKVPDKKKNFYKTAAVFVFAKLVHMLLLIMFTLYIFRSKNNGQLPDAVFYIAGGLLFLFIIETILLIIFYYRQKEYAKNWKAECNQKMVDSLIKQFENKSWDDNLYIKTIQIINDNKMCR